MPLPVAVLSAVPAAAVLVLYYRRRRAWPLPAGLSCLGAALATVTLTVVLMNIYPPVTGPVSALALDPGDRTVIPGGESVFIHLPCSEECTGCGMASHVAMYLDDGLALITGHASFSPKIIPGRNYTATLYADEKQQVIDTVLVTVLADTGAGQLVSGLPAPDREAFPVGAAVEGPGVALVHGQEVPVAVVGADSENRIILRIPRGTLGPGVSGAPVVQDGRLIAIVAGVFRPCPHWAFSMPACRALLIADEALDADGS